VCLCEWPLAISRERERERERNDHKFNGFSQSSCENKHKERKRKNELFSHRELFITMLLPSFFLSRQLHSHPGLEKYHRAEHPKETHTQREMIHIYFVNDVGSAYIT
jgi:hypothetical protein